MTQEAYARKILERFGMTDCHGYATPEVDDREDLWHDNSQPQVDHELYRSMVGSLMYLMTCTRPDIAHAVQRLSRHLHDPRAPHVVGAKRVLRYVKQTIDVGLTFRACGTQLVGYCDASWATRPGRRSTSSFICFVGGSPVSWRSARQRVVAMSTCEAEYVALAELAKEMVWLRGLLEDMSMHQEGPSLTCCDNKAAISTSENVGIASRSKHIDLRHHFIRQLAEDRVIRLRHVGTADQLADALTKVSTKASIDKFKSEAMAVEKDSRIGQSEYSKTDQTENDKRAATFPEDPAPVPT